MACLFSLCEMKGVFTMRSFPTFAELEAKRDEVNAKFHRETEPQLIKRLQEFGFQPQGADEHHLVLKEGSTDNCYLLTSSPYAITIEFQHVRTGESIKICEISNFSLNAHTIMNIIVTSVNYWLQYGVVYDYFTAQNFSANA